MPGEYLSRNVKRETEEHYKNRWPFAADARRNLYIKYAKDYPPEVAAERGIRYELKKPRDIWCEIADDVVERLGDTSGKVGLDVGSSSGYFARKLYAQNYRGRLIGVDIEMGTQPGVETIIKSEHPHADIVLGGGDAQYLTEIKFYDKNDQLQSEAIPSDYFDFVTELFVLYHVPSVRKAYNAAHRVVKPDGLVYFSGRHVMNQHHLWQLGGMVAEYFGVKRPDSFYDHHSLDEIENHLTTSPKYELLNVVSQAENLWIKADDEGWQDYKWALMTLPYGRNQFTGKPVSGYLMERYLESTIRPQFESQASKNNGYFIDYVFQKYFVTRAIK